MTKTTTPATKKAPRAKKTAVAKKATARKRKPATKKTAPAAEGETSAEEETAQGLDRLKESFGDLNLGLFQVNLPTNFSSTEGSVEEIFAVVEKIREGVPNSLKWIRDKDAHLATIDDRMKRRIAAEEWAKEEKKAEEYLEYVLNAEYLPFRVAAAMAFLQYVFSLTFKTTKEAGAMLADLETRGLVKKVSNGRIHIGYDRYNLGDFGLEDEDEKEVTEIVADFSRKLMVLVKNERQQQTKVMEKKANISMDGVWDGENGRCVFDVPAESYTDSSGKNRWRGGGKLLVEVTDKDIIPLSASGAIESLAQNMKDSHVRLQRHTLKWDCPPANNPKSFERVMDGVMRTHDMNRQEAERYVNRMKALWYLLIRAYKAQDAETEFAETKEEFRTKANITPQQFFGLNGSDRPENGDACLEFQGDFHRDKKESVFAPFFLARRSIVDGRSVIEVVDMPTHVHDLLGSFVGKQYSEGEDFRELPPELGRVIRAVRGQEELAAELNKA